MYSTSKENHWFIKLPRPLLGKILREFLRRLREKSFDS